MPSPDHALYLSVQLSVFCSTAEKVEGITFPLLLRMRGQRSNDSGNQQRSTPPPRTTRTLPFWVGCVNLPGIFFSLLCCFCGHFVSVWVSFFNSFHFSPFRFVFCVVLDPRDGHSRTARYLCLCPFVFAPFLSCHASGLFLRCPYVGPPAGHLTRHIQVVSAAVALSHPNSACALECKFAWFHVFFILCISFAKNSSFISVQNVHAVSSVSATGVCR